MPQPFEHRLLQGSTSYWKFLSNATPATYQAAFSRYVREVKKPQVTQLLVAVEEGSTWDPAIENLWRETAKLANAQGIRAWGIVTPASGNWQEAVERLAGGESLGQQRNYSLKISASEAEILEWLGVEQLS